MLDSDAMRDMHMFNFDASNSTFHVHVFVFEDPLKQMLHQSGLLK